MQQLHQVANEGLTVAQALLAVLIPIGTFGSTLAGLFLKRHFRFIDRLEKRLEEGTKLDAEIAVELRLGREAREGNARRIAELEGALGKKIDDHRTSEMAARVGELAAVVERQASQPSFDEEELAAAAAAPAARVPTLTGLQAARGAGGEGQRRGRRSGSGSA